MSTDKVTREAIQAFEEKMRTEGADGFAAGPHPWEDWDVSGNPQDADRIWDNSALHDDLKKHTRPGPGERLLNGLAMVALLALLIGIAGVYFSDGTEQTIAHKGVQPLPIIRSKPPATRPVPHAGAAQTPAAPVAEPGNGPALADAGESNTAGYTPDTAIAETPPPAIPTPDTIPVEPPPAEPAPSVTPPVPESKPATIPGPEIPAATETAGTPSDSASGVPVPAESPETSQPPVTVQASPPGGEPATIAAEQPVTGTIAPVDQEPPEAVMAQVADSDAMADPASGMEQPANVAPAASPTETPEVIPPPAASAEPPPTAPLEPVPPVATEPPPAAPLEPVSPVAAEPPAEQATPVEVSATDVATVEASPPEPATDVAAVSAPSEPPAVPPSPEPAVALVPAVAALMPADTSGGWAVNLVSYTHESTASRTLAEYREQGIDAEIQTATINDKPMYRVRIVGYESLQAAQAQIAPLQDLLDLDSVWASRK